MFMAKMVFPTYQSGSIKITWTEKKDSIQNSNGKGKQKFEEIKAKTKILSHE